jgi:hypothetical protein
VAPSCFARPALPRPAKHIATPLAETTMWFAMMGKRLSVPFVVLACLLNVTPAFAHDSWISRGGFRGPKNGEWCCGANDCFVVSAMSVKVNGVGYELSQTKETVPYEEAIPSADGQYWRCQRPDGSRRCFFAPMMGY